MRKKSPFKKNKAPKLTHRGKERIWMFFCVVLGVGFLVSIYK